jgi:rhamnosyltransferase
MLIADKTVKIIVPTYNAGSKFKQFIAALLCQRNLVYEDILIIDSSSQDGTVQLANEAGFAVQVILREDFSHGGTRAKAVEQTEADVIVFLSQDAILAQPDSIEKLVNCLRDDTIAAAFGRQLPNPGANVLDAFARLYNYPAISRVNSIQDKAKRGIKTAFFSDSFACYDRKKLLKIGNFDTKLNYGEDTVAAAKLLLAGYKTAYCAEATVYHSHNFTLTEEFERYKTTGKFHQEQQWLLQDFGKAEGEGLNFVKAELKYLLEQEKWYMMPYAFLHNAIKYAGYKAGT